MKEVRGVIEGFRTIYLLVTFLFLNNTRLINFRKVVKKFYKMLIFFFLKLTNKNFLYNNRGLLNLLIKLHKTGYPVKLRIR